MDRGGARPLVGRGGGPRAALRARGQGASPLPDPRGHRRGVDPGQGGEHRRTRRGGAPRGLRRRHRRVGPAPRRRGLAVHRADARGAADDPGGAPVAGRGRAHRLPAGHPAAGRRARPAGRARAGAARAAVATLAAGHAPGTAADRPRPARRRGAGPRRTDLRHAPRRGTAALHTGGLARPADRRGRLRDAGPRRGGPPLAARRHPPARPRGKRSGRGRARAGPAGGAVRHHRPPGRARVAGLVTGHLATGLPHGPGRAAQRRHPLGRLPGRRPRAPTGSRRPRRGE